MTNRQGTAPGRVSYEAGESFHTPQGWSDEDTDRSTRSRGRWPLLDDPSDPAPLLNKLMEVALWRLDLVAGNGTVAGGWGNVRITNGNRTPDMPRGSDDLRAQADQLATAYNLCTTHRGRFGIIAEAQHLEHEVRYSPDQSRRKGTPEWKRAIIEDPRSSRTCEGDYGVSYKTIQRIRKQASRPSGTRVATSTAGP